MFTLDPAAKNVMPDRYRSVAVSVVEPGVLVPPALDELAASYIGREAYLKTRFIVARAGDRAALVEVDRPPSPELFSTVTGARLLAGPDECVIVSEPATDVAVPAQLAAVASRHPDARCVIVEGRYSHLSFLLNPSPLHVLVIDVVPPSPSKLLDQAQRILDLGEDLPPVVLHADLIDSRELLAGGAFPTDEVLLPCRVTGDEFGSRPTSFLDQRPEHQDWILLGCERSAAIHEWFYGEPVNRLDTCPRRVRPDATGPTLTRCCLLQEGGEFHADGPTAVVPWGSTLGEVRAALIHLIEQEGTPWTPT